MFKLVLQSVSELSFLSVSSLLLFFFTFIAITVWVIKMDKKDVERMSRIPFDDNMDSNMNGEAKDE